MKIIAATDFQPAAHNAVRSAVALARKLGDSVLLVRALEPALEAHPELRLPESTVFDAGLRQAAEAEMSKTVATLAQEARDGVLVEGRTVIGAPARALADEAGREGARLIVMGLRSHGALARLVLGSVAEATVRSAPCPVLLIPPAAAPFDAWVSGARPLRALVGLDLDPASDAVLERLAELRQAGPCDLTLVHAYWPPAEYTRLGLRGPRSYFETDAEVVTVLEREIRARFALPGGPGSPTLRIESAWGRVGETLARDAETEGADLVVVGTRQPHGWDRLTSGSSAIGALRAARTAVLCVPARPRPAARPTVPTLGTLLAATDLSPLGDAAVAHAYGLLRSTGGVIELCHVHARHVAHPALYDLPDAQLPPARRAELEGQLSALIPPEAEAWHITTHVNVIDGGSAGEAILQAARRLGADAIALGSHGRSGVARTLVGSVADTVLRGSDKPVLVIRSAG